MNSLLVTRKHLSMGLKEKAETNFKLAETLRGQGDYNAAANRFYYSVFQAICFYAERKLGYVWDDNTRKARLSCGKTGTAHGIVGWIVQQYYPQRRDDFYDLLDCRETADYERNDVSATWLTPTFIRIANDIKIHFLNKGV